MTVRVLRLGHRVARDKRITTHCCLVSRAFGAEDVVYTGQRDRKMEESVNNVVNAFGGKFSVAYEANWKKTTNSFKRDKWKIAHLTVYGLPFQKKIKEIRKEKNLLVVVGGEKVPSGMYHMADWNISVTSQPHSEIAALSVFLHDLFGGKELNKKFTNAKKKIIPQTCGKKMAEI